MRSSTNTIKALHLVALYLGIAQTCSSLATPQASMPKQRHKPVQPELFYRVDDAKGQERVLAARTLERERARLRDSTKLFYAVHSERWPAGLVPVFEMAEGKGFALKRLPVAGEEKSSEPLFFALPLEDESEASILCGQWEFTAVRNDSTSLTSLQVTYARGEVSARFDQNTDYGFAQLNRGTFQNNELTLTVQYISDSYLLRGKWDGRILTGQWKAQEESEHGTWRATQEPKNFSPPSGAVRLFEWRRPSDGALRYATEQEVMLDEWQKNPDAICRVWKVQNSISK